MTRLAVTGAAGLVGQNLVARLVGRGGYDIVAFDKQPTNTAILRELQPGITVVEADLAEPGPWQDALRDVDAIVIGHAQIGGLDGAAFERNNVLATRHVLQALPRNAYVVHISSSVVNSRAVDFYTETKKAQEALVAAAGHETLVLRPTLMFGWFDRKHIGWLARFMRRTPIFPVPGTGQFQRQPLYAGDLCAVIIAGLERRMTGAFNISGQERVSFLALMRTVKAAAQARAAIVRIPYAAFHALLATYALADRNPPFTTRQLAALVVPELFEVIDWPGLFGVAATPLRAALEETFRDPRYAHVTLEF